MEYYLKSTRDASDRTAEIEALLQEYGTCLLGPGTFVVSGVKMPDHAMLRGEGPATKLLLSEEGKFTVQLGSYCTVRDLTVMGSEEEIELPEAVGDRHGLLFLSDADPKIKKIHPRHSTISGIYAHGFTGGGITCHDTGYSVRSALNVSDCHLYNCGAGINISHFSEYHCFTNIHCIANLYGCINNGGNNMFVNCSFSGNAIGFLIDNSRGQSNNNSHGSVVGCTFNHSGHNEGIGIQLLGACHGHVFSGCQVFFSQTILENCNGILFDSMNYGRQVPIRIKGGSRIVFSNSMFLVRPDPIEVVDNDLVQFENCYTRDGEKIDL